MYCSVWAFKHLPEKTSPVLTAGAAAKESDSYITIMIWGRFEPIKFVSKKKKKHYLQGTVESAPMAQQHPQTSQPPQAG